MGRLTDSDPEVSKDPGLSLAAMAQLQTREWRKLTCLMTTFESNLKDMCDVEFTVEE
jgi:hypothetical protein